MKTKHRIFTVMVVAILVGCQGVGKAPATISETTAPQQSTETPIPATSATPEQQSLPPLSIDWTIPFAESFSDESPALETWTWQPYTGKDFSLPLDLRQVVNIHTLDGLTLEQKTFLASNGFVVIHSQEAQFGDIRIETSRETGQPYYLTVDAAFHALHLNFDELLKALEREYFLPQIIDITKATLQEVQTALPFLQETSIQTEAQQALAYLYVALKLFDPETKIDPSVADLVNTQIAQIVDAGGRDLSVIFPDFEDDYGAYKPVGHYAGDPDLEAYFRGMTWLGRMHFRLQDPENPGFVPSRIPLIVTLALRKAQVNNQPAATVWADLHTTLTFVIGPSDDAGPLEYAALMDQVYGNQVAFQDLSDDVLWQDFLSHSDQLPTPQINSLFVTSTLDLTDTKGWRFMGQRFTLDGQIMQNLIYDRVQAKPDGTMREFPSGLDVMAAFGSQIALHELEAQGFADFPNYSNQMAKLQQNIQAQTESEWTGRFYDGWLYSFFPVIQSKDSSFPAYMQTRAWGYKDLNTALGGWAELKHDTVLYTKMPDLKGGGGPPTSGSAPSYVEPNPLAFYRMAYMSQMLSCGLQNRVMNQPCISYEYSYISFLDDIDSLIQSMSALGDRFKTLGDIALKELTHQPLTSDDNFVISQCLGTVECLNLEGNNIQPNSEMPKVPIVAAVSGAGEKVLEVGVGNVDRIYVVVPLEDKWEIAQGGVFSYYEFNQLRNQRLTDEEWRAKLASGGVSLPPWSFNFILPGGRPTKSLFFRIGDFFIVTESGNNLNVRDTPSINGKVIGQFQTGEYVKIIDGPVTANGYIWWKWSGFLGSFVGTGWAVENQEWYVRSYTP